MLRAKAEQTQHLFGTGKTPLTQFAAVFLSKYKLVEDLKQDEETKDEQNEAMDVEDGDEDEEKMGEPIDEEDPNAKETDFKQWLSWTAAHVTYLRCLLKLADRIDKGDDSDDEGAFEDIEIDDDAADEEADSVIDIDQVKLASLGLINLQ